ncbi:MAG: hypothetical protein ABIR66_11185 [Saprospiraceae bacterium]
MVEVFKTDVTDRDYANMLTNEIHKVFVDHKANFDLEDCDNILRIKCSQKIVQSHLLIRLLKDFGFHAEILPDDLKPVTHTKQQL